MFVSMSPVAIETKEIILGRVRLETHEKNTPGEALIYEADVIRADVESSQDQPQRFDNKDNGLRCGMWIVGKNLTVSSVNTLSDETGVGLADRLDVDDLAEEAEGGLFMGLPVAKMNRRELLATISVLVSQAAMYQASARELWGENIGGDPPVGILDPLGLEVGAE